MTRVMTRNVRFPQSKASLDKQRQTLEAENADLANDLKQVQMAKQESERKRKQVEGQYQEATIRLQESERGRGDNVDKVAKLSVRFHELSFLP